MASSQTILDSRIRDEDVVSASETAVLHTASRLNLQPALSDWSAVSLRSLAEKDPNRFLEAFEEVFQHEPSSGNASTIFCEAVLAIIGLQHELTAPQRNLILSLCTKARTRPLPTMLWANFVQAKLDNPGQLARVLTACQRNKAHLERRVEHVMSQRFRELALLSRRPILVLGYSETIVGALRGIPPEDVGNLEIVTPRNGWAGRTIAHGELFAKKIAESVPGASVEVINDEVMLSSLREGDPALLIMGCRVVGLRYSGELEVANPRGALEYLYTAKESKVPVGIVAGAYKLWPTGTYECSRPLIVLDDDNDIIPSSLFDWVMTEDGVFTPGQIGKEYPALFNADGIPIGSIRGCLGNAGDRFKTLTSEIKTVVKELGADSGGTALPQGIKRSDRVVLRDLLPDFVKEAEVHYETVLQQDEKWVDAHASKYLALFSNRVVDEGDDLPALYERTGDLYGFGGFFFPRVSHGVSLAYLTPNTAYVTGKSGRLIYEALVDPRWEYRTVEGISGETKLTQQEVEYLLDSFPEVFARSPFPDIAGRRLYTLRANQSALGTLSRILSTGGLVLLGDPTGDVPRRT